MKSKNIYRAELAMSALDEIPEFKPNALEITAVVKDGNEVVGYQLSNEKIVSKEIAIEMASNGDIKNVGIAHNKNTRYLKSLPDGNNSNNLGRLPIIDK